MSAVFDSFDRADSAVTLGSPDTGPAWVAVRGTWGIVGNRGYCATGVGGTASGAVLDTGSADGVVEVTIATQTASGYAGLLIRCSGTYPSGFFLLSNQMYNVATLATVGPAFSATFVSGDRMRVVLAGTSITVFRQAGATGAWAQVMTTTSSLHVTNTKHGLSLFHTETTARFEDFFASPTQSLYMPDVKVEIAFNAGYSTAAASRAWTDVSAYVVLESGISITRGRSDEFATCDANVLKMTLDNRDGRFTPGKTGGAYYPNVKIGRPIRVTSTLVGSLTPSIRFLGYVDEWPVEWDGTDAYAEANISAVSRMARIGFDAELHPTVTEEILVDNPVAYYPMNEDSGATAPGNIATTVQSTMRQAGSGEAVTFGNTIGEGALSMPAATFAAGKYLLASPWPHGTTDSTLEFFAAFTGSPDATLLFLGFEDCGWIRADATGHITWSIGGTGGTTAGTYNDGLVHHYAITGLTVGSGNFYIDGVSVGAGMGAVTPGSGGLHIGDFTLTGSIAHVAVYNTALSGTRILAHADAGLNGFSSDTASERILRYAEYGGIPTAEVSGDAGTSTVAAIDTTGRTAIDAMRTVETTENGVLFDSRDNTLTFKGRASRYNTTAALTLNAALGEFEAGLTPKLDRSVLVNDITGTASDGSTVRAINQTSIDNYGYARQTVEVASSNDFAYQLASWLVNNYGEPVARIPALGVDLLTSGLSLARQEALLAADVGTKITLSNLPAQAPASSIDFFVEGYTENIGPESYTFSLNVSPAPASTYYVWTLEDAVYGQYDAYPIAL